MPVDLSKSLVIGISSRALFDLEEADRVSEGKGEGAYAAYQEAHENEVLRPGIGFRFVQAIQGLNRRGRAGFTHQFSQGFQRFESIHSINTRSSTPPRDGDGGCSYLCCLSPP